MKLPNNYYLSSFFWSTFQKIITAVVGFISVPLLLGYYGKADYGVLGIATACNGYMHLLDLGMNVGAVKYFSQWRTEGKNELINRVARTNITFYIIISIVNIIGLVALAFWGESVFSVSRNQFLQLRACLLIIALFNVLSWGATTFNQLLIAHMQMAYTMQVQSIIALFKGLLVGMVFLFNLSLIHYFFFLTGIVATLIIPYVIRCRRLGLIDSIIPAFYWKEFKVVILFSLSIFALSLFQMTSTQSRPIVLSIFANDGAGVVAEYRIIEVIPQLIIMICGSFSAIFLPKASQLVAKKRQQEISIFAYKWTLLTTIIANCMCFPFILGSKEILSAYVGSEYSYLSIWLIIWVSSVLFQVHSTPTNALILAYGRTKVMVYISAMACVLSIFINAFLSEAYGVGAAIIGYFVYIVINLSSYYGFYFKMILHISTMEILKSFLIPTFWGGLSLIVCLVLFKDFSLELNNLRLSVIILFLLKAIVWFCLYIIILFVFKVIKLRKKRILTKFG